MSATLAEQTTSLDESAIQGLAAEVRGNLIQPGDAGYDDARKIYNGMHDRRPRLVVRAADVADVIATVSFAADKGVKLSVRAGGHNVAGFGTNDGGVVLD